MTTVISRLFPDEKAAQYVQNKVVNRGVPSRAVSVISSRKGEKKADLLERMQRAQVHESAIDAYASELKKGRAVVVVRATYKPLTAATIVRDLMARQDPIAVPDVVDDYYVTDGPPQQSSILKDHPRFLTVRPGSTDSRPGPISDAVGLRLLSPRKSRNSAWRGGGFMSRKFWPMPLLATKERKNSVIRGGRYISKMFWPMPLLSTRPRRNSVIRGGGLPFSRALGWPPLS